MCKFVGELGDGARDRGVYGAAVANVPFVPEDGEVLLGRGFNKLVYSGNFLKSLKPKAEKQAKMLADRGDPVPFDIEQCRKATTIGEFDDAFIAPIYGFADKAEYYKTQGSKRFLKKAAVPLLAVHALDDPFIARRSLPTEDDVSSTVRLEYHEYGGHCGWIAKADREAQARGVDPRNWMPDALAAFVAHVEVAEAAAAAEGGPDGDSTAASWLPDALGELADELRARMGGGGG